MEIITAHKNMDFDGLASMVAAGKLYPNAILLSSGKDRDNVHEFISLYKDVLPIQNAGSVDLSRLQRLILVDTSDVERAGDLAEHMGAEVELIVYDHHPLQEMKWQPREYYNDFLGACVSQLVEELGKRDISINPFEATLMALGIYEDTGMLTFPSTTLRDIKALAWLVERGANISVVSEFIEQPLSDKQRDLLQKLSAGAFWREFSGVKVMICTAEMEDYASGLGVLAHRLSKLEDPDALFLLVRMGKKTYIVARSNVEWVNVRAVLQHFGGGGHEMAASAIVRSQDLAALQQELLDLLPAAIKPTLKAEDLMTRSVKTVDAADSMGSVARLCLRSGHSGFPVMEDGRVVGVISRRDVEKAEHHGLGHAPVKAFMNPNVQSIPPDAGISEIRAKMIEHDVGRLPVMADGKLLGIVSRTDVLRVMHGDVKMIGGSMVPAAYVENTEMQLWERMTDILDASVIEMLKKIADLAAEESINLYLVGGVVRDILMGHASHDIDLVTEGDGMAFAQLIAQRLGGTVERHDQFATAGVTFSDHFHIDIASARQEYYEEPAALPVVEGSTIKEDLYRRDFTVNAMAISLNPETRGLLIDFFNGRSDLEKRYLRVLHNLSFIEDPTRLLRALRFEHSLGFNMDPHTADLAQQAIESGVFEKLTPGRIKDELLPILRGPKVFEVVGRMMDMGLWPHLFPELSRDPKIREFVREAPKVLEMIGEDLPPLDTAQLCLLLVCFGLSLEERQAFAERFALTRAARRALINVREGYEHFMQAGRSGKLRSPGDLYRYFKDLTTEEMVFFIVISDLRNFYLISQYLRNKVFADSLDLDGSDLKKMGLPPGPIFGRVFSEIRRRRLNGKLLSREEQLDFAGQVASGELALPAEENTSLPEKTDAVEKED